jgi:hypothetical protein
MTALTSMCEPNLSTSRVTTNVLDPPPHVVSLDDGKSLEFELLADAFAVGILQAPGIRQWVAAQ